MIIAIDTGGTKTLAGRFDDDGQLSTPLSMPTPKDVDNYLKAITGAIHQLSDGLPISTISLALPGVIHEGVAVHCINLGWRNVPIKSRLQMLFPEAKIRVENDANLAGLASMRRLETLPACGLYITLGTGVGTSLILGGHLHDSLRDCEGGHMMLYFDGKPASWEEIASGRVIQSLFGELSDQTPDEAWPEIARRITAGLGPLVAFVQPEVVVIGGSVGAYTVKFASLLSGMLAENLPSLIAVPRIVAAPHPHQTVLYGCYDYATDGA